MWFHLDLLLNKWPLNSDHLSTTATIFGSWGWSLNTSLTVCIYFLNWFLKYQYIILLIYWSKICFCDEGHNQKFVRSFTFVFSLISSYLLSIWIKTIVKLIKQTHLTLPFVYYDSKKKLRSHKSKSCQNLFERKSVRTKLQFFPPLFKINHNFRFFDLPPPSRFLTTHVSVAWASSLTIHKQNFRWGKKWSLLYDESYY